ncbi:MAG: hypothetical protein RIS92_1165 [Verrucomicrobiota bacterium]|jgi:hypothetical protein
MMRWWFREWTVGVALLGTVGFCEEKGDRPLEIPLVRGEDSLGVVIPEHRLDGTLKSRFSLAVARLVEGSWVEVERSLFESVGKDGGVEVKVKLDLAQLDLATRRIRSEAKVVVVTPQYEVISVGMDFDWAKKEGDLKGPVTMTFSKQARLGSGAARPAGEVGKNERK